MMHSYQLFEKEGVRVLMHAVRTRTLCSYIQFRIFSFFVVLVYSVFSVPVYSVFFYVVLEYSVSFLLQLDFFVSRYKGDLLGDACNAFKQMRELDTADGMVVMK